MPQELVVALAVFVIACALVQAGSIALVLFRPRRRGGVAGTPPVSIVRPVCGIENNGEATLRSGFALDYPDYELIFCVADGADAVVPLVERLMREHAGVPARLLVGDDRISVNPKLNNIVKGWAAARREWVVMADSNVLMPPDYLQQLLASWTPGTGLVCSPPVGTQPEGFWAEVECAFLNTFQARWQLAADAVGNGFAQGKTMLWRREELEAAGGIALLASEVAEDAASTKFVRAGGKTVRLVHRPFPQPLGRRRLVEVWRRQVRWARLRRASFFLAFMPELLAGALLPAAALAGLILADAVPALALPAGLVAWYGAEALLARAYGWPVTARSVLAWVVRDLTLQALWVAAVAGSGFVWRGHQMAVARRAGR